MCIQGELPKLQKEQKEKGLNFHTKINYDPAFAGS